MKTLILLLLLFPTALFSQQKSEVIELAGKSSGELYVHAKEWLALNTKLGNLLILIDNPSEQKIISTGVKNITYALQNYPTFIDVNYAISLQFKDGRFKYTVDIKSITTKEGWKSYMEKTGMKPVFNKKVAIEANKNAYTLLYKNIDGIISELTSFLKNSNQDINW